MRKYIRPAISLATIGVFVIMAMASFGPDAATNTTVPIKDCEEKPSIQVQLEITVHFIRPNFTPFAGVKGKLFISHQKVNPGGDCTFSVNGQEIIDFTTDASGLFTYNGNVWNHNNSEDLIRVEIYVPDNDEELYIGWKEARVHKYDDGQFRFFETIYTIL